MSTKLSGPPSFGYFRRGGMLRVDQNEAPIRLRVFELFAEHKRKKTVAGILNAEGHRTRSGAEFTGPTVGRLIKDPTVKGIDGVAEALVSEELWQRCNDLVSDQEASGGAKRSVVHLFAGLVNCHCGGKMYVPSRSNKYVCSDCRVKIPKDDLEAVFHAQLGSYSFETDDEVTHVDLSKEWLNLPFEKKREIVEYLVGGINIAPKRISIRMAAI